MNKPLQLTDWTVLSVGNTQTYGANGFQKRELVITNTGDKYEQFRVIEAVQDKCVDLDGLSPGDKVTVDFWAGGRKWTDPNGNVKYFNQDKLASITKSGHDWDRSVKANIDLVAGTETAYASNPPKDKEEDLPF